MDLTVVSTVPLLRRQAKREQSSVWLGALRRWRRVTLGGTYLSSTMSRRTAWTWMFPVAAFVMCLLFCVGRQIHVPCLDVFSLMSIVVALLVASYLPVTTLWPDILISVGSAALLIDSCLRRPMSTFQEPPCGVRVIPFVVLTGGAIGLHSSVVSAFGVALSIFVVVSPELAMEDYAEVPCSTLLSAVLVALAELCVASLVTDLQNQSAMTERLLDAVTDGFCTLDAATSTMTKASPQLEHAFGCDGLVGARLTDFVDESDWCKLDFNTVRFFGENFDIQPVHVTCKRKLGACVSHMFDAQIAPYTMSDGHLGVYLRVLGEMREFKAAAPKAAPASLDTDAPEPDVAGTSVPSRSDAQDAAAPNAAPASVPDVAGTFVPSCSDAQDPNAVVEDGAGFDRESGLGVDSAPADAAVVRRPAHEAEASIAFTEQPRKEETLMPSAIQDATTSFDSRGKAHGPLSVHVQTDPCFVDVQRSVCKRSKPFDHALSTAIQVSTQTAVSHGSPRLPPLHSCSSSSSVSGDDKSSRRSNSSTSSRSDDDKRCAARRKIKALKPTPLRSCSLTIARAMRRWHRPCTTGACCAWHTALNVAKHAVEFLEMRQGERCDSTWGPLMHWQCHRCLTGNEDLVHQCATCGTARGAARGTARGAARGQSQGRRVAAAKETSPSLLSL